MFPDLSADVIGKQSKKIYSAVQKLGISQQKLENTKRKYNIVLSDTLGVGDTNTTWSTNTLKSFLGVIHKTKGKR